ncbi:hypothetical protein A8H31_16320 [Burkholderia thailandensis]|nr:hypothetical protein A8H31_16320 [Burkholderia thailandensis]NOK44831.1 hypothetical protein [Burkholderia thailandensis]NOK56184.1 hypothetical protein [Burkholderia thailandensis]PNE70615.1 hypothetical protein A8H38_24095 [Burkholderia thailandensis]PNE82609.1 hypothetical protein A8H34_24815 [Burkholderia thailandensis]
MRASDRGRGQARDSTRVATCRGAIATPMTCFFRARFRASMFGFFSVHAPIRQGFARTARYSRDCDVFVTVCGCADTAERTRTLRPVCLREARRRRVSRRPAASRRRPCAKRVRPRPPPCEAGGARVTGSSAASRRTVQPTRRSRSRSD